MPHQFMNMNIRPNIFTYQDHVHFLNDWFAHLKKTQSNFSLRGFSKISDIALGYITMILKRERELTEKGFQKIAPHLTLDDSELTFLNLLRIIGQSENSSIRLKAVDEMMKMQKYKLNNKNENRTYEYLTKWYYVAIYEMFNLSEFKMDIHWIRGKLRKKLSLKEIEQALEFLKKNEFVRENSDGSWSQSSARLECTEGIFKVSLAEFHNQMLDLAHESIHTVEREKRLIMGQTMALSKSDFLKIKDIIQNAFKNINDVNATADYKEDVYHIEIAAFPLSDDKEKI
jgi:uncharacterized protein (TIGR02147 family)